MMYNRIFLLICFAFTFVLSSTADAQTQKHNIMVGGNGSYVKKYRQNINPVNNLSYGVTNNTYHLNTALSYFVVDNLAVGLSVNYRSDNAKNTEGGEKLGDGHFYYIGPILRYYFLFDKWAIFPEAQILKVSGINHSYSLQNKFTNSTDGSGYKVGVGTSYFITRNVGLEGLLSYSSENTTLNNDFNMGSPHAKVKKSGINFSIGIQFYLTMTKEP